MTIGNAIRTARLKRKIKQFELAAILGVATSSLCAWEKGKACPRHSRLAGIAKALHVTVAQLVA